MRIEQHPRASQLRQTRNIDFAAATRSRHVLWGGLQPLRGSAPKVGQILGVDVEAGRHLAVVQLAQSPSPRTCAGVTLRVVPVFTPINQS